MHRTTKLLHKSPEWRLTGGGFYQAPKGRDFPMHCHQGWEFVYYQSGFITCVHGKETFQAEPGLLWLTPPGVFHAELARTAYRNIYFEIRALSSTRRISWPRSILDDDRLNFKRLCTEIVLERSSQNNPRLLQLLLDELFIRIDMAAKQPETSHNLQIVRRAEVLIASSLDSRHKIYEIAKKVGVSVSGLRAAFHVVRGKSPLHVLREIRCQRAVALLQNSTLTLEALAQTCGYDSASHLSREIKQSTGRTPGRFRHRGK